jgi:hypothetical protein
VNYLILHQQLQPSKQISYKYWCNKYLIFCWSYTLRDTKAWDSIYHNTPIIYQQDISPSQEEMEEISMEAFLMDKKNFRREAKVMLKSDHAIDNLLKSFVRHPVTVPNRNHKRLQYTIDPAITASMNSFVDDGHTQKSENTPKTEYVAIGVGGGTGVECRPPQNRKLSDWSIFSMNTGHSSGPTDDCDSSQRPVSPPRPSSPCNYSPQPNHNNGSPRAPSRQDNYLPIWHEISSPAEYPPSPGHVVIRGTLISERTIQQQMIDIVRHHDSSQRKRFSGKLPNPVKEKKPSLSTFPIMKLGEIGFEDSFRSRIDDSSHNTENSVGSIKVISKPPDLQTTKSYMDLTAKSKLSSLARIEDDYAVKWIHMKSKRDERRQREVTKGTRSQLLQQFSRVVNQSDK